MILSRKEPLNRFNMRDFFILYQFHAGEVAEKKITILPINTNLIVTDKDADQKTPEEAKNEDQCRAMDVPFDNVIKVSRLKCQNGLLSDHGQSCKQQSRSASSNSVPDNTL